MPSSSPANLPVGATVRAVGLQIAYSRGGHPVLNGLSMDAEPGQISVITGPSGCGKSTLLYMLGIMLKPTEGCVKIGEVVVSQLHERHAASFRARNIGFVFQDSLLDASRSVTANVVEGALFAGWERSPAKQEAARLLAAVGLDDRNLWKRRPGGLSGGQAQRVALCRALIKRPGLVLADEPTGNLDSAATEIVLGTLRESASQGAAVIIATHDEQVLAIADQVVRL